MPTTLSLPGQVNQIKLSPSNALWPLFETVVNSIQSLEDTDTPNKYIVVEAIRSKEVQRKLDKQGKITDEQARFEEFIITDNGNGFIKENYESFLKAYSQLKSKKGCKGIGRFLWLKAFEKATIHSVYTENGKWYFRDFDFSLNDVEPEKNKKELGDGEYTRKTTVILKNFKSQYRDSVPYALESLAKKLIEHCLPYFIIEPDKMPQISLRDDCGEEIDLNEYYRTTYSDSLAQDKIELKGRDYRLYHMLLSAGADRHELHFCANNREVKSFELKRKIPNLQHRIETEKGLCYYIGYLTGDYLDETVNQERSAFVFEDLPICRDKGSASESEVLDAAVGFIQNYLHEDLDKIQEEKKQQIDCFVQSEQPKYRFLLNKRPEVYEKVEPGLTKEKLALELHRHQIEWEHEVAEKKAAIDEKIRNDATADVDFQRLFDLYCEDITDLGRAVLAEYITKRRAIIELLAIALQSNDEGDYSKEERLHKIFCPMKITSNDVKNDAMNLWLIDDRLAYHRYLASDLRMKDIPILENDVKKRMDIAIFDAPSSYTADSDTINSITIVEFKRPQRDDVNDEKNPIDQVYDYISEIRDGKAHTYSGRGFGNTDRIAFYCYVIADLTPTLIRSVKNHTLTPMPDGEGFFGYNHNHNAYIEVLSYDKVLKNAKQRNQILFDKLFAPSADEIKKTKNGGQLQ